MTTTADTRGENSTLDIWQRPFVQNVLPFVTSLVLHAGLIVVGLLTVRVISEVARPAFREQSVIPEATVDVTGNDQTFENLGLGNDRSRKAMQDKVFDAPPDSKGLSDKRGTKLSVTLTGGGAGQGEDSPLIAIGSGGPGRGKGLGFGVGDGIGSGNGDGGELAPFGPPGGVAFGPGPKVQAGRIAYVCDASGSMVTMFDALREEIRRSTGNLKPNQSYNVVFFQDAGFKAADSNTLLPGTPDTLRKVKSFLEGVAPHGDTNPIPALEAVFKMKPEVIYLLTDGDFTGPGNEAVVNFCRKQNVDGKVKIITLAFIGQDDAQKDVQSLEFVKTLKQIAKDSGGRFQTVGDEDFGK